MEQYRIVDMFTHDGGHNRSDRSLELARLLADNGRLRMAFFTHPPGPNDTPEKFHLRSLFHIRWMTILESFAKHIDPDSGNFWRALKQIQTGDSASGLAGLQSAGSLGARWSEHYQAGLQINEQLRSPNLEERLSGIANWEQWQANHPGPKRWQPAADLVTGCRGAAHIFSELRNLRSQFFVTDQQAPATIEVCGPTKIRLEIRPVHLNIPESRIDEWYTVSTDQQQGLIAALGNTPSQQLRIEGVEQFVPGRLAITELRIPSGRHKICLLYTSDAADE